MDFDRECSCQASPQGFKLQIPPICCCGFFNFDRSFYLYWLLLVNYTNFYHLKFQIHTFLSAASHKQVLLNYHLLYDRLNH
jgi:hypothetical protein